MLDASCDPDLFTGKVVVFCHGYKGFKDWGPWNAVAHHFTEAGFGFVKFNFSYNGVPIDHDGSHFDAAVFAENNLSTELDDLGCVIDWLVGNPADSPFPKVTRIGVIGHSRGGGIAILRAGEDRRIDRLASWAAVSDFADRFPLGGAMIKWKDSGVYYVENKRTGQQLPHHFQFYEDYRNNTERLTIREACYKLACPHLVLHGTEDEAVHFTEAMRIHKWSRGSVLHLMERSGHTFGAGHPWRTHALPEQLKRACDYTVKAFAQD